MTLWKNSCTIGSTAILFIALIMQWTAAQDVAPDFDYSRSGIKPKRIDNKFVGPQASPKLTTDPLPPCDEDVVYESYRCSTLLNNVFLFGGANAFANKGDDNHPNNFGMVGGFNLSLPTGLQNLRYQFGFSHGAYDWMGREGSAGAGGKPNSAELANYFTAGVYQRSDIMSDQPWSFGVVFDHFMGENWGEEDSYINLSQVRYQIGYALNQNNEIGFWGTQNLDKDLFAVSGVDTARVQAQRQANLYYSHMWSNGAVSTVYAGLTDDPGDWIIGTRMINPVTDRFATYANFHYVRPSTSVGDGGINRYSEAAYTLGFGCMINFGGKLRSSSISGHNDMPYLSVADQGLFGLNIPTGNL
jgi:hypothetical protein